MRILEDCSTTDHRLGLGEITLPSHTQGPAQHRTRPSLHPILGLRTVSNTKILNVAGIGSVQLTVEELGDGKPYLVSHGRAGPQSVAAFTQLLAEEGANRVITPTHPGFGGTPRPDELNSVVSDGDPATRAARDPEPGLNQPFSCVRVVTGPF
jgi:hypothetical protein